MSEIELPLNDQRNWQKAIDPRLQERLMRPVVKPGIIDTAQLAGTIIERSQRLNNRLPLVTQLQSRLSGVKNLSPSQLPIVYAQPVKSEANVSSVVKEGSASSVAIAPGNSLASGRVPIPIVQAKFTDSAKETTVSEMPVMNSNDAGADQSDPEVPQPLPVVPSQSNSPPLQGEQDTNAPLVSPNTSQGGAEVPQPLPVVPSQSNSPPLQGKQDTNAPLVSPNTSQGEAEIPQPLPVVQSRDSSPPPLQGKMDTTAPSVSPHPNQGEAAVSQPLPMVQSRDSSPLPLRGKLDTTEPLVSANTSQVAAEVPQPLTVVSSQSNSPPLQGQLNITAPSVPTPIVQAKFTDSAKRTTVSQMPVMNSNDAGASQSAPEVSQPLPLVQSQVTSPMRVQRKMAATQAQPLSRVLSKPSGSSVSLNNLQATPTQVNKLPIVQSKYSDRTNFTSPAPNPKRDSLRDSFALRDRSPRESSLSPEVVPSVDSIESPLPLVQVVTGAGSWLNTQSNPLLKDQTASNSTTSEIPRRETTGLNTPLAMSVPPSLAGMGQQLNKNPGLTSGEYSAGIEQASSTNSAINTGIFQKNAANTSPPSTLGDHVEESSASKADQATKIDVDALVEKIERKLMRQLVIENERRGHGRWR